MPDSVLLRHILCPLLISERTASIDASSQCNQFAFADRRVHALDPVALPHRGKRPISPSFPGRNTKCQWFGINVNAKSSTWYFSSPSTMIRINAS